MIRVLALERLEKNKQSIARFEKERVDQLGGIQPHLSDSRVLDIMSKTCESVWGNGEDLHLASQRRTLEMVAHLVVAGVDDNLCGALNALGDWLKVKILYERRGNNLSFRFEKPNGDHTELQIPIRPMRQPEQPDQRSVQ